MDTENIFTTLDEYNDYLIGIKKSNLKVREALLWEGDGFLLLYKCLDNGSFQWPRNNAQTRLLTHDQYVWLMQGLSIEQPKAIRVCGLPA